MHTKFNIRESLNLLFYGSPTCEKITQTNASKIRKNGIPSRSQLYHDYIESNDPISGVAANLKKLRLDGIPANGKELLETLDEFSISNELQYKLLQSEDIYHALSILLFYSITSVTSVANISNSYPTAHTALKQTPPPIAMLDFFYTLMKNPPSDICIDMAFPGGHDFFRREGAVELLTFLLDSKAKIRIIVNTGDSAKRVVSNMHQPNRKYDELGEIYADWMKRAEASNGQLSVKTTQLPLLHRTYLLYSEKDSSYGGANARFYTYGSYKPHNEIKAAYLATQPEFEILKKEFAYLWAERCV